MNNPYETVSQIMAERDQLRAELAALKAGQGEAVAVVVSAYGDPEAFGEREVKVLADLRKIPYGTKLYTAPPASADAVPVPRELLKEATDELAYFDKARIKDDKFGLRTTPPRVARLLSKLRALLAQSESKVKP